MRRTALGGLFSPETDKRRLYRRSCWLVVLFFLEPSITLLLSLLPASSLSLPHMRLIKTTITMTTQAHIGTPEQAAEKTLAMKRFTPATLPLSSHAKSTGKVSSKRDAASVVHVEMPSAPHLRRTAPTSLVSPLRRYAVLRSMLSSLGPHNSSSNLPAWAAPLMSSARHTREPTFAKSHAVSYVQQRSGELENPSRNLFDSDEEHGSAQGDDDGSGTVAAADTAADSVEPSVVDFTKDVAPEKLDRLYHRAEKGVKFLSPPERKMFTKMVYETFYKDEGTTVMDPSMLYQASLEVQWIEEWMARTAKEKKLSADEARREVKRALLERVDLQKPLSYIIGSQPFFGCDIHCEEPLLCPRPETEMWTHWLVYEHLNHLQSVNAGGGSSASMESSSKDAPLRILDVCCGTGCIGVALARHVPSAVVTALDILPQAVRVSQENARRNGVPESRYTAIQSDMFEHFLESTAATGAPQAGAETFNKETRNSSEDVADGHGNAPDRPLGTLKPQHVGTFDVIVSNPPYVLPNQYVELPRSITHWESKTALVGDDYRESRQYLYFKELCVHGVKLLKPRHQRPAVLQNTPNMLIEVGLQAHMVAELMEKSKVWQDVVVHLDYAQQERWVSAVSAH